MPAKRVARSVELALLVLASSQAFAQAQVSLQANASPTSGTPGQTTVTLTGSGFPSGATAANTVVSLTISSNTFTTAPVTMQTVVGGTRRISFVVPSGISVQSPAAAQVTVSNAPNTAPSFSSTNHANLTINPEPSLSSVSPTSGAPGGSAVVQINGLYTSFAAGTTASFGAGISVGGGPLGGFGPVTVNNGQSLTAALTIDASAASGARTVTVRNGSTMSTLPNAFTVSSTAPSTSYGVTLNSPSNPPSAFPPAAVTVTGTNFPPNTKTINPANVTLTLAPVVAGAGPAFVVQASSISGASGANNTRAIEFSVPGTISVPANTPYLITLTGDTVDNVAFASLNSIAFAIQGVPTGPPVANAGVNQTVALNSPVTLNGSKSTDPSGRTLSYAWSFVSVPPGSVAALNNRTSLNPTFTPDKIGSYIVQLIVNDGLLASTPSTVTISTQPAPPSANAGPNQVVKVGSVVALNGAASTDPAGLPLTYSWSFSSIPSASGAALSNSNTVSPAFTVDKPGTYLVSLKVNNGYFDSTPSTVTISTQNVPPVADAGPNQMVSLGSTVHLDGSGSSDPNGLPLGYQWALVTLPSGSAATLTNPTSVNPAFFADVYGAYVVQLIVADGVLSSNPSTVTISTNDIPPVANAGPNQSLQVGSTVYLNGAGSTSLSGLSLTYKWSLVTSPAGSSAVLTNSATVSPTFVAGRVGAYVVQLIVSDGVLSSNPTTITITSNDVAPTANAGPNQANVPVGGTVQLDGSGSTDLDGHPLTYAWTILTQPQGSTATLSNPTALRPTFVANVGGTYVVQLIVNDGILSSQSAAVTISTDLGAPVANAGPNQQISVGSAVTLDGTHSTDPNGYPLTYSWSLISRPAGSTAALSGGNTAQPIFTVDKAGTYIAQLIVSDPLFVSQPATVTITTTNMAPVADPGSNQTVRTGTLVTLDGSQSLSFNGNALTYAWSLLSKPAGSTAALGGANTVHPAITPDLPGPYQIQLIVNDGVQNSQPVTVVITGVINSITISLQNSSLITYSSTTGNVHLAVPAGNGGDAACAGQVIGVSLDNTAAGTISTATSSAVTSVCVAAGAQDAPFTLTTASASGNATITGFADEFQNGTHSFTVSNRQVTISLPSANVAQGRSVTGTIVLNDPAPGSAQNPNYPGNGLTVNLSSNLPNVAGVTPSSVTIAAGQTAATFTINGNSPDPAVISAGPAVAGFNTATANITVTNQGQYITIPQGLHVGPGQSIGFPVSVGGPVNGTLYPHGLTITLSAGSGPGTVTFNPATVVIPAGATTPAAQPQIVGGTLGLVPVTAGAPNYQSDVETVNVAVALTLTPPSQTVLTFNTANYTLSASSVAPAGGLTVHLSMDDPAKATVPASVVIAPGMSSAVVTVTGVAAGATTLRAGLNQGGFVAASATVTVADAPATTLYPATGNLGLNEQQSVSGSIAVAAPAGNLPMTITSANPAKFLLSADPNAPGTSSITVIVSAGSTSIPTFYIQGLASSGSATLKTHAKNYADATLTYTLVPTGFVVTGGGDTTTFSNATPVYIYFEELNPTSLNYIGSTAYMRPGAGPVTVRLSNSKTGVGALGSSSVTIGAGQSSTSTTFQPSGAGTAAISIAGTPSGYTTPYNGQSTVFSVTAPTITVNAISVGQNLETYANAQLAVGAPNATTMTIISGDASRILLSTDPSVPGSASISFPISAGQSGTPAFYIQSLSGAGTTASITVAVPGYATGTGTVTINPSGFAFQSGSSFSTAVGSNPTTLTITPAMLDPQYLTVSQIQEIRPGLTGVSVTVTKTDQSGTSPVGEITLNPVTFNGYDNPNYKTTSFNPLHVGTTLLQLSVPAGFTNSSSQITAAVTQ